MDETKKKLSKIPDGSIDFVICDPWNVLTVGGKKKTFETPADRDEYIKKVQKRLEGAYKTLKSKPAGGSMMVGVNMFSMTSFGDAIFEKEEVKRALVWFKEQDETTSEQLRGYRDAREYFLWIVKDRNWTYNLLNDEKYFDGEFKTKDGDKQGALSVVKDMVLRFTNEGDRVLEVSPAKKSVVRDAVESLGRIYVQGKVSKKGSILNVTVE